MKGNSKPSIAVREQGIKIGIMQGLLFARIGVWYELLEQVRSVGEVGNPQRARQAIITMNDMAVRILSVGNLCTSCSVLDHYGGGGETVRRYSNEQHQQVQSTRSRILLVYD